MLELRGTILAALAASFEVTRRLHQAGNVPDLTLVNDRALYEEARVAFTRAEADVRARREELNALMGLWGSAAASWTVRERLPAPAGGDPDVQDLEARAIDHSIDLAIHRRRFTAAAKAANLRRAAGWLPELSVGVSAEREAGEAQWAVGPALAIELPLFYQGRGETGAALAEARREQRAFADAAIRIRSAARSAAARLSAAQQSATYYRDILLPLRQRIVDETQLQFNAMSVGAFQLLQAKRDQIEAARTYVELLRSYWTARAEVDQLSIGRVPAGASRGENDSGVAPDAPEAGAGAH
jgi:outer membrane protein TolC